MKILIITLGVLALLAFLAFLFTRKPKPVDTLLATYTGRIEDYRGDKKLVVGRELGSTPYIMHVAEAKGR